MSSPFSSTQHTTPGHGLIHLALLPHNLPRLRTVEYQYPLKLVAPDPTVVSDRSPSLVHTVYLLTYGGGLVAGDHIDLKVVVEGGTRLTLLTQGSTKLYKSPSRNVRSKQYMTVDLHPQSALCYLPDPVQPFAESCFEQQQTYNLWSEEEVLKDTGSLCVLDWVSNGRSANGEDWSFYHYSSRNEVRIVKTDSPSVLLLRDSMILHDHENFEPLTKRMHAAAVVGTLIVYGQRFAPLMDFFMAEFKLQPRIGGRTWDAIDDTERTDARHTWRKDRHTRENTSGLLWSAAALRGAVLVKFSAPKLEVGRQWLRDMLDTEGTVQETFGESSLLCL